MTKATRLPSGDHLRNDGWTPPGLISFQPLRFVSAFSTPDATSVDQIWPSPPSRARKYVMARPSGRHVACTLRYGDVPVTPSISLRGFAPASVPTSQSSVFQRLPSQSV